MAASFDNAALAYDKTFTHSTIGKLQRQFVHSHLKKILQQNASLLEINCGTGEDALWISKQNLNVTATDISPRMIEVAKGKSAATEITFQIADINQLEQQFSGEKFDIIFSNF